MDLSPNLSLKQRALSITQKLRNILLRSPEEIRSNYGEKPITLLKLVSPDMRFPKKIREAFALIWTGTDWEGRPCSRFIMKGPRGGGKSQMLGAYSFVTWYIKLRSMVCIGGSLAQAQGVYNYFIGHIYAQETIINSLPSDPTLHRSKTEFGNYYKAAAASPKAVRGPHPDELIIDEAVEAKDQLILDALPMVNTSQHQKIIMTSTFHKIFGIFQETWDNAEKMGYCRISWDAIDVCSVFDPSIWEDETLRREIADLSIDQAGEQSLEFRVNGRTGDPDGWVPIMNVVRAWRERKSTDWFDVEYMGSRPSSAGLVNNPDDVDACVIKDRRKIQWKKGTDVSGGIDWGYQGMTSWTPFMAYKEGVKVQLESRQWTQVKSGTIISDIVNDVLLYRISTIYSDASHPFENEDLRTELIKATQNLDFRCTLITTPFVVNKLKDDKKTGEQAMLGNYRAYWQRRLLLIPAEFKEAIWQHKRYHFKKNSETPEKEDDHIPDSTMLALRRWPLGKKLPTLPASNAKATKRRPGSIGHLQETQGSNRF